MPPRIVPTESVRKPRRTQRGAEPCVPQGPVGWCEECSARVILPCVACRARAAMANSTVRPWGKREPKEDLRLQLTPEDLESYKAYRAALGLVAVDDD